MKVPDDAMEPPDRCQRRRLLAVFGPREKSKLWTSELEACAERVGRWIAEHGWTLACGGLSGAGRAAVRGCREAGGLTVAITPGDEDESGAELVIRTRLGVYRNFVLAHCADAGVAIAGGSGTLQEASLLHELGRPFAAVRVDWGFSGLQLCADFDDLEARFLNRLPSIEHAVKR